MIVGQGETIHFATILGPPVSVYTKYHVQIAICFKNSAHTDYKQGLNSLVNLGRISFIIINFFLMQWLNVIVLESATLSGIHLLFSRDNLP